MKIARLVGAIFASVGLIFVAVAGALHFNNVRFASVAQPTTGIVIELVPSWSRSGSDRRSSPTYASRVAFLDRDGQPHEFVESASSNPPRHSVGEDVPVLYDPASPSRAVVDDLWGRHGLTLIMGPLGAVLALVGIVTIVLAARNARRRKRLRSIGRPIQADFLHVILDEGITLNGRHPFRVVAQATAPDTGLLRRFESEPLRVDPTARLECRTVTVLVDPKGSDDYLMDLSNIVDERDGF